MHRTPRLATLFHAWTLLFLMSPSFSMGCHPSLHFGPTFSITRPLDFEIHRQQSMPTAWCLRKCRQNMSFSWIHAGCHGCRVKPCHIHPSCIQVPLIFESKHCDRDSLHPSDVAHPRKHGDEHGALHRRRRLLGSTRGEGDVGGRRTRAHLRLGAELVAPRRAFLADATMVEDVDGRF